MTKKLLFVMALVLALTLVASAADVTGKWTYEQAGRGGGNPTTVTLNLKQAGSTVTGTQSRPGRDGAAMETPISEGKIDGDNISFTVTQSFGGNEMKTTFKGTVSGSEMKLQMMRPGRDGGPGTPVDIVAKKSTT
jgi:opacity protein-like surface antigen